MDFNLSLRRAIKTGNVILGQNSVDRIIADKSAKLVIIAKNAPEKVRNMIKSVEGISIFEYDGTSRQLGKDCGRDHMVSVLAIVDAGESDILNINNETGDQQI
ncbi:MAG TPA: 50S ribosomal protein L30e [Methanocorpusculum sp.]|nr:50S ribosomal protein L30e [Methanocorpusculum sp.]